MLIGIDASRAVTTAPTGTETYSREIIAALLKADSPHRFRLYTRTVPLPSLFPATNNYKVRAIPFPRVWTHARLSVEMLTHAPDALFVPAHVLPLIHPRHSIVTVHDLGYLHFPQTHRACGRWYLDLSTRWNVRAAACVLVDSNSTRDDLIRFYRVNPEKIRVVYPALSTNLFQPVRDAEKIVHVKSQYQLGDDYLIAVGTIHPRKNYARLLHAFERLPEKYQLIIVGKRGWLWNEIFATVENFNLGARVRFLDYVDTIDLPALYAGARLCVFPSLYEGFGFPVLEAQACGTPVICSNTSSLPEVAGDAAEFFDPRDVDAMVAALAHVLDDDVRHNRLSARGLENVKRFSWTQSAIAVLEILSQMR